MADIPRAVGDTFDQVVRQRETQVLRTAYRILGNWADAEDATQEAFVRLHRHRPPAPVPKLAPPVVARQVEAPAPKAVHRMVTAIKPARHREHKAPASGSVLIRLETPDPEVVILLIGD